MRLHHLTVITLFLLSGTAAKLQAQCEFDPVIALFPQAEGNVYCSYDTVKLTVNGTFDSYQWHYNFNNSNTGGTPIGGAIGGTYFVEIAEWGFAYFYVTVTLNGCTESSPAVLIDSYVFLSPAIAHDPESTYCKGDSTLISNAFGSFASYQWYRDGEPIAGATQAEYWVTETGYYVLFASPELCPQTVLTSGVGPSFEFVGPEPPVITVQGNTLQSSSGPNYQWYLNGSAISGATTSTYTPTESGAYTVRVSDNSGCAPESAPVTFVVTGTRMPDWAAGVEVFPNPATSTLHLRNQSREAIVATLLDITGRQLLAPQVVDPGLATMDLEGLQPGLYLCRLQVEAEVLYLKILKDK
ncbi:MAG: T9SS type A sorting domain-containing protein [Saprospiraceae bacterium]|nr:T9SS type A sorting domain-containing protein [Saprospiraceae bacterium]